MDRGGGSLQHGSEKSPGLSSEGLDDESQARHSRSQTSFVCLRRGLHREVLDGLELTEVHLLLSPNY